VRTLPEQRPDRDEAGPTDASAGESLREATAALDAALAQVDLDAACWTFGPERLVSFWPRRQAQEALVHHHDAAEAAGQDLVLEPAAAVEGVDEYLEVFVWRWGTRAGDWLGDGQTCHLHATDAPGEWHLTLRPDAAPVIERAHAKGDVAVRGPAARLLLGAWRRRPLDDLEWLGAPEDVTRWQQRLASLRI